MNVGYKKGGPVRTSAMHDWMRAIRTPTQYRVGTSTITVNSIMLAKLGIALLLLLTFLVLVIPAADYDPHVNKRFSMLPEYNATYPLSPSENTRDGVKYKIAVITDLDHDSKSKDEKNTWLSFMRIGYLTINTDRMKVKIEWEPQTIQLKSSYSQGGRGMELSELVAFNGRLYSVDDRTGIVYEITRDYKVVPWVILSDGDGHVAKGFKAEWATVKDKALWIRGIGKEWTSITGVVQNLNTQFVKSVGYHGDVMHIDWHENYDALRKVGGYSPPGYMIHESGVWSDIYQKWFFFPRRASTETYTEEADERRAANLMFTSDEYFKDINMQRIGPFNPVRGFSSFKFVPGTSDTVIVVLKSEEDKGHIASYISFHNRR